MLRELLIKRREAYFDLLVSGYSIEQIASHTKKSPAAVRYTKECVRAVRFMNEPQAQDYLAAKSDALRYNDKENSREEGMKQFLDEKSYRPGFTHFKRKTAQPAKS